jgi:hypothetical protein
VDVAKGEAQQSSVIVAGANNPAHTVAWTVEGGVSGTTITDGLLTVESAETAASLTVTAASTVDASKSGTAAVTVIPAIPRTITVTGLEAYNGKTFAASLATSKDDSSDTAVAAAQGTIANGSTGTATACL